MVHNCVNKEVKNSVSNNPRSSVTHRVLLCARLTVQFGLGIRGRGSAPAETQAPSVVCLRDLQGPQSPHGVSHIWLAHKESMFSGFRGWFQELGPGEACNTFCPYLVSQHSVGREHWGKVALHMPRKKTKWGFVNIQYCLCHYSLFKIFSQKIPKSIGHYPLLKCMLIRILEFVELHDKLEMTRVNQLIAIHCRHAGFQVVPRFSSVSMLLGDQEMRYEVKRIFWF